MTKRVFNFSPGPATLPLPALERAQGDLLDFDDTGMGILEHSHRGASYSAVHQETKALLRELLGIPDGYHVLFMQGGARGQFALVPMNLLHAGQVADYVVTGVWGEGAIAEAKVVGEARLAASTKAEGYTRVPRPDEISAGENSAYVHVTSNNTIYGTQFHDYPDTGDVPLINDMSSDIASRPIDVSRFGLIYAGAQKNLGPAGVTIVIVRDDLVQKARTDIPSIFRYKTFADKDSLGNTAPTFAIYMVRNVLRWVADEGGVEEMAARNQEKSDALYAAIDAQPDMFRAPVEKASRSQMNAVFRLPTEDLDKRFVAEAAEAGLMNLKGHRLAGGIRVSLYNAMPLEGVERLIAFMEKFAKANG